MAIGAIIGGASALIGGLSARSAQRSAEDAAREQLKLQERVYDENVARFDPYYRSGLDAQDAYLFEMGLGPRPVFGAEAPEVTSFTERTPGRTYQQDGNLFYVNNRWTTDRPADYQRPGKRTRWRVGDQVFDTEDAANAFAAANATGGTPYQGFTETPGYQFRLGEGQDAVLSSVAGSRGLNSGAAIRGLTDLGQNLASAEYGNYMNRLANMASGGQAAAGQQASAGNVMAQGGANALANLGSAGAAGAVGMGNALQGGLNTFSNIWGYQQAMNPGNNVWGGGAPATSIRPMARPF